MFQKEEKPPEFIELKEDKRMKKLVTIVLVIALLSTMLALPAAASQAEPRLVMIDCESCGTPCPVRTRNTQREQEVVEPRCYVTDNVAMSHMHMHKIYEEYTHCETCGDIVIATFAKVYCGINYDVYVRTTDKVYV